MATLLATTLRRLLQGGLLIFAAVLIFQAAEIWFANCLVTSDDPVRMQRGAELVPGNADSWDRLGRFHFLNFANPDNSLAIANYEKAVRVDPLSHFYWMDLANAYESAGEIGKAKNAYMHAREVYPTSADVQWTYGNFLLRQNDSNGYSEIQQAVRGDVKLLPQAISRVWRSTGDMSLLIDKVIPSDVGSYLTALDFFCLTVPNAKPAMPIWRRIMALNEPFPLPRTFPFLDELIREDDPEDAEQVWNQALLATNNRALQSTAANLISDPNFQGDFPNGGLGWRWKSTPSTSIDFDQAPPGFRGRSVRLDFGGGANLDLNQPSQFVAVQGNIPYHFRALMRTEALSTDSGMRFYVTDDPRHSEATFLMTDNFTGSHNWTPVGGDFTTGPQTHFLLVRLYRAPSRFFENRLSGTAWIADVTISKSSSAGRAQK